MNKLSQIQSNLIEILLDLSSEMNQASDYDIIDSNIETADKLSTIIKRIGESCELFSFEQNEEDKKEV